MNLTNSQGRAMDSLRQQSARDGANMSATKAAWAKTVEFFRQYLEN